MGGGRWGHSHFKFHTLKFLQCISPNLTFLQYKFCLPNLTRLPNAHAHELHFEQVAGSS